MLHRTLTVAFWLAFGAVSTDAQTPESNQPTDPVPKAALQHEDCELWRTLGETALSRTGAWLRYALEPADRGDGEAHVHQCEGDLHYTIERARAARFDWAETHLVCLVDPERDRDSGREAGAAPEAEESHPALAILELESGLRLDVEGVRSFALPEDGAGWLAYLRHAETQSEEESTERASKRPRGAPLVLRELETRRERSFDNVTAYRFSDDGGWLAFATSASAAEAGGVFVVNPKEGSPQRVAEGGGPFQALAFDAEGGRLAFLAESDDPTAGGREDATRLWSLYLWTRGEPKAREVAFAGAAGIAKGWGVSQHRTPSFSESGDRLFFGTAPEASESGEASEVVLDVWSWTDERLQTEQLVRLERDRRRSYLAVIHLEGADAYVVQLATLQVPGVSLARDTDSAVALATSDAPYRKMRSWDTQVYHDVYVIDIRSGERTRVLERRRGSFRLSPQGRFLWWWDGEARAWFTLGVRGGEPLAVTREIPHPLEDVRDDRPQLPRPWGAAGWLPNDDGLIVYDEYDLWLCDPRGVFPPRCLTEEVGRSEGVRYRLVDLDLEREAIDPAEPLLLSALNRRTKHAGFWRDAVAGTQEPSALVMEPRGFSTPVRAESGGRIRYTRSSFTEFPDVWVSDLEFSSSTKVSSANPQQARFRWGSAELVEWQPGRGEALQGILYKPDDFDPARKYPLLAYFYERNADGLHRYHSPIASRSTIRIPFYTSRGYIVFVPDIAYRVGRPGASALDAVFTGVRSIVSRGFIDESAIGVQGHSWGGYQIAYLVTQTRMFAAAVAGAPVSNMTSAYGGIRWGSGLSRMFQYEKTQSRIGGTLWGKFTLYRDNSPLFFADQVETPLLILHNDRDGAVPWYQGIELFVALRRLGKPSWLLNYNGEQHGLTKYANRVDYAVRMQQFFDHYLRGERAPIWLSEGIPALRKGKTLGLELSGEQR